MKNAVNLGQLFLSWNDTQLTFTEGKVSLRVRGGEVYLEEKGYSGSSGCRRIPGLGSTRGEGGAWTALLPPRERERLLG